VCSLDNFDLLISGRVSNTLEKQGIADASDIPAGAGKGNKESNPDKKTTPCFSFFTPCLKHSGLRDLTT
jgi:hypothetical protein